MVAEKFEEAFEESTALMKTAGLKTTICFGIASDPNHKPAGAVLIGYAGRALDKDKSEVRDRVAVLARSAARNIRRKSNTSTPG